MSEPNPASPEHSVPDSLVSCASAAPQSDEVIRFYRPTDREAVRRICCETGFLGKPIDTLFEDREIFADFLTSYYTDFEPESCVVLEAGGQVCGYIMGCRHPERQSAFNRSFLIPRLLRLARGYLFEYNASTRSYIRWLAWRGWREVPQTPQRMAHFHINLLPDYKKVNGTRALIEFFLAYLRDAGEPAVYGQMVTFAKRRGERMFARYGFRVVDSVEVTKFRAHTDQPVFLFTVIKDLTENVGLYGNDLWNKSEERRQ